MTHAEFYSSQMKSIHWPLKLNYNSTNNKMFLKFLIYLHSIYPNKTSLKSFLYGPNTSHLRKDGKITLISPTVLKLSSYF